MYQPIYVYTDVTMYLNNIHIYYDRYHVIRMRHDVLPKEFRPPIIRDGLSHARPNARSIRIFNFYFLMFHVKLEHMFDRTSVLLQYRTHENLFENVCSICSTGHVFFISTRTHVRLLIFNFRTRVRYSLITLLKGFIFDFYFQVYILLN